ncbi:MULTISPECIES: DUF418 domain-containing protein [Luteimonas]|uniref:DUF418 domain-containing protein n=1 Tax=Luteimonas TaxID=83614 RepID=UPI000C7E0AFF|nr:MULTISPECIES: DUF418 domain-containing protein [Luteimonas]
MREQVTALGPLGERERIGALDALRGVALLGVLLMNVEWFSRPLQQLGAGLPPGIEGIDHGVAWLVHVFVASKFWVLFSMLFGMGFVVFDGRIQAAGASFERLYLRRLAALFVFGLLHITLLWPGDILHTYAIAGIALLLLRGLSARWQLWLGLAAFAGMVALNLFFAGVMLVLPADVLADMQGEMLAPMLAGARRAAEVYANGSFGDAVAQRWRDYLQVGLPGLMMVPMIAGVFLVGSWLMRSGRVQDPAAHRGFWWRLLAVTLPLGALLTTCSVALGVSFVNVQVDGRGIAATALLLAGALPLSLAYVALAMLAWGTTPGRRALAVLAPVGRMALTNYLMQSLVLSLLFFGYGAGLWGEVGRAAQTGIALALFAAQVLASHAWLARFRQGPMEGLWRWLTYGRRPAWRRAGAAA